MQFQFICDRDRNTGSLGWRPKSTPGLDPYPGIGVAHDCLEHFTLSAAPSDEFMAFGASLYVRGEEYYTLRNKSVVNPGIHLAYDLMDVIHKLSTENYPFPSFIRSQILDAQSESWIDSMFLEFQSFMGEGILKLTPVEQLTIRNYMRLGYRKADKRYDGRVCHALFIRLEDEANLKLHTAEIGDELNVQVNFKRLYADVELIQSVVAG